MRFCTAINCIDGRVQLPVINYLQKRFNVEYVDSITEAGPGLILSEEKNIAAIQSIFTGLDISIEKHNSAGIAIVVHHDCAANPAPENDQIIHLQKAIRFLRRHYEHIEIIGLSIDKDWQVHEIEDAQVN